MALTKQKRHTMRERLASRGFEVNARETMVALAEFMGATSPDGTSLVALAALKVQLAALERALLHQLGEGPEGLMELEDQILQQKDDERN